MENMIIYKNMVLYKHMILHKQKNTILLSKKHDYFKKHDSIEKHDSSFCWHDYVWKTWFCVKKSWFVKKKRRLFIKKLDSQISGLWFFLVCFLVFPVWGLAPDPRCLLFCFFVFAVWGLAPDPRFLVLLICLLVCLLVCLTHDTRGRPTHMSRSQLSAPLETPKPNGLKLLPIQKLTWQKLQPVWLRGF